MNAILIDKYVESYDELKVTKVPYPQPHNGDVIVKVEAAGVNFVDSLYCRGKHQNNHRKLVVPPFILGLEFAGTVITQPINSPYPIGTRVFGTTTGAFTTHIAISPKSLHPIPANLSFTSASTLAATLPVSYGALITRGNLQRGETVLIHGASGGLGLFAIQIAKAIGATVIATASTSEKLERAKKCGADHCVNYSEINNNNNNNQKDGQKTPVKWAIQVLTLTHGKGVDVVFDTVGLVTQSLKCLKPQGRILIVGFAGREGNLENIPANKILLKQAQITGYRFGETNRTNPAETHSIWQACYQLLEEGKIKPVVFDKSYIGLESVKDALRDLTERKVRGKAVIRIGEGDEEEVVGIDEKRREVKL